MPTLPDRLCDVGMDHARDKKRGTVLDGLAITCYQQRMSKPLTDHQSTVLHNLYNRLMDDTSSFTALVAANDLCDALERIYFLERKLKAVDNHLVSALLSFADGEYNSPTLSDYTIQGRAIDALEAYNDITE
jgi:hypothetical protein